MPERDIAADLRRALRHLTWATVVLYGVVIVVIVILAWRGNERQDEVDQRVEANTLVLCSFRSDLEALTAEGLRFDATLLALDSLDCPQSLASR